MKTRRHIALAVLLPLAVLFLSAPDTLAQNRKKGKKARTVQIASQIVDGEGIPVAGAVITAGEGAIVRYSDAEGRFSIRAGEEDLLLVEAEGFEPCLLNLRAGRSPKVIHLAKETFLAGKGDLLERADGSKVSRRENIAAVGTVDVGHLLRYPGLNLSNAFQGQAAGMIVRSQAGGLGTDNATFYVRGQHAAGGAAIVVIDGIERSLDDLSPEEIGSVQVLKDAPAKILYGPRGANGVILVTTRRGQVGKKTVKASIEYGPVMPTRMPAFLDAYRYASLYNEARANDGLAPVYTEDQLRGYATSSGPYDNFYPNVDWYGLFAGGTGNYRKASAEFLGGNSTMQYALVASYTGGSGLESLGKKAGSDRFNLRGNLDIRINRYITAKADVAARIGLKSWGAVDPSTLFSRLSSMRPNEYALTLSPETLGLTENTDGTPYFGGSTVWKQNLLDDQAYGSSSGERYVVSQTDLGLDFDLGHLLRGLSADAYLTFDNYSYLAQAMTKQHATYAVETYNDAAGDSVYRSYLVRKLNDSDDIDISDELTKRTIGARGDISFQRTFGRHGIDAAGAFRYYRDTGYGSAQDCITTTATARFAYNLDHRLFADLVLGVMGSNQVAPSRRHIFTPALAVGYIFRSEPFIKVKASAGRTGYDPDSDYLLYHTTWVYPGNYAVGETGNGAVYRTALSTFGNPDLGWITSDEVNLGGEFHLLGRRLRIEADLFAERRQGGITGLSSAYSSLLGDFIKSVNYTRVLNRGLDLSAGWSDKAAGGDFRYTAGVNLTLSQNRILKANEVDGIESWRSVIGHPTSGIFALRSEGLFGKEVALDGHAVQTYGPCTDGDVAYADLNGDGIVDGRDETFLGQTFPLASLGINLDLRYKGFGLYVLGTSELGHKVMLNNRYYWNNGIGSYSEMALYSYHPENNPDGTFPRLTTSSGGNSYMDSSFWLADGSFFRLKNLEFSYTLEPRKENLRLRQCRFFLRGTNLLVLTSIQGLDPEVLDAGVSAYPVCRTVSAGATFTF